MPFSEAGNPGGGPPIPTWDGHSKGWKRYAREVGWYVQGTEHNQRRSRGVHEACRDYWRTAASESNLEPEKAFEFSNSHEFCNIVKIVTEKIYQVSIVVYIDTIRARKEHIIHQLKTC